MDILRQQTGCSDMEESFNKVVFSIKGGFKILKITLMNIIKILLSNQKDKKNNNEEVDLILKFHRY